MKKKMIIAGLSALLIIGGATAVGAAKSGIIEIDSIHLAKKSTPETPTLPEISPGQEIEVETVLGKTFYKVEKDGLNVQPTSQSSAKVTVNEAAKIALAQEKGTITGVENEMENGRLGYQFEIESTNGEVDIVIDAETGEITRVEFDDED